MKAKLFMNGHSQAVRLPKEFRFEGTEVEIRSEGNTVILEPLKKREWPEGFFDEIRIEDDSFMRPDQPSTPDILALDSE